MSCAYYSEKRRKCHSVYGTLGEDCLAEELQEKRCLSIQHCPLQAKPYYGTHIEGLPKALCGSWAEAFAFRGKQLELGEDFADRHEQAQQQVNSKPQLKDECRQIARDLARCLQSANITRR